MNKIEFTKTLTVDTPNGPKRFESGQVVDETAILPGSLESCQRLGQVRPYVEPAEGEQTDTREDEEKPDYKKEAKPKKGKKSKPKEPDQKPDDGDTKPEEDAGKDEQPEQGE
jgi:hypothetical protein